MFDAKQQVEKGDFPYSEIHVLKDAEHVIINQVFDFANIFYKM
jgi:hypothetical protein